MENKKLTDLELQKLQELQANIGKHIQELGQLEVTMHNISEQTKMTVEEKSNILKKLHEMSNQEQTFLKELSDKYGQGNINVATGEISQ